MLGRRPRHDDLHAMQPSRRWSSIPPLASAYRLVQAKKKSASSHFFRVSKSTAKTASPAKQLEEAMFAIFGGLK